MYDDVDDDVDAFVYDNYDLWAIKYEVPPPYNHTQVVWKDG